LTIRVTSEFPDIPVESIEVEVNSNPDKCPTIDPAAIAKRIVDEYMKPGDLVENTRIREYRRTLWSFKVDPTKTRPSPEALARRIARGKPFPHVSCAVDMVNLASLEYLVCIGLYDADKLPSQEIVLRTSRRGEKFHPIGGGTKSLPEGIPVASSGGEIIHLYPSRDSSLTAVDGNSRRMVAIAYGYRGDDPEHLRSSLRRFKELLVQCGCVK
jgi:DNA/RNA-binding domain of Phe-tRNA-synthetase-like protein